LCQADRGLNPMAVELHILAVAMAVGPGGNVPTGAVATSLVAWRHGTVDY